MTDPSAEHPEPEVRVAPTPSSSHEDAIRRARDQAAVARERRGWTAVAPDALPGYQILQEIHRGGQGVVYLAIQKSAKRKVAVKVMHGGAFRGSRGRARFQREVEILGQLHHPNIVSVHDSGTIGDCCYIVMDYISGQPLDEYITAARPSIEETLTLFVTVCQALNAAHLKGVIHRDLKPANIRVDADGLPHILDFGLAKVAGGDSSEREVMSMTGQFIGSLPWASPEQAHGSPDRIDVRTDVYSLGVILYQMLTDGRFPYEVAGAMRDVLDNILRAEPSRPSSVRRQIDDELETIVLKCLSKERERRYQNAGDLGRDLARYLSGEPVEAKRDSGWYVFRKTVRRHRPVAMGAGAFLALLVIFSIAMTISRQTEARAADDATRARDQASEAAAAARLAQQAEAAERERAEALVAGLVDSSRIFFEFDEQTVHLRGGFDARVSLLHGLSGMLARVEPFVGDHDADPRFLLLVAESHRRVGRLYGSLYGAGDRTREELERSLALHDRVLAQHPAHAGALHGRALTRMSLAELELSQLRLDEAMALCDAAAEDFTAAAAAPDAPADLADDAHEARLTRARAMSRIANGMESDRRDEAVHHLDRARADLGEAELYWKRRALEAPDDARAARALSLAREEQNVLSIAFGRLHHQWARRVEDDEAARRFFDIAVRRLEEAVEFNGAAALEFARLLKADPRNAQLARDRAFALMYEGEALVWLSLAIEERAQRRGEARPLAELLQLRERAVPLFEEAVDITVGLEQVNDADVRTGRDVALCLNKLGNQLRVFGWENEDLPTLRRARLVFEESLERRQSLWADDQLPQNGHDLAVGLFKVAEVTLMLSERDDAADRDALRHEACVLLEEAALRFGAAGGHGYPVSSALRLIGKYRAEAGCDGDAGATDPPVTGEER